MPNLDDIDKAIVNRIQSDFPITSRPYLTVAEELDLTEKEVLERVARLKKEGIIRRIGGNFVPGKLGFVSTLCAARVPADKIKATAILFASQHPAKIHMSNNSSTHHFNGVQNHRAILSLAAINVGQRQLQGNTSRMMLQGKTCRLFRLVITEQIDQQLDQLAGKFSIFGGHRDGIAQRLDGCIIRIAHVPTDS